MEQEVVQVQRINSKGVYRRMAVTIPKSVIEKAQALYAEGKTLQQVADILAADGVKSWKTGVPCTAQMAWHYIINGVPENGVKRPYRKNPRNGEVKVVNPATGAVAAPTVERKKRGRKKKDTTTRGDDLLDVMESVIGAKDLNGEYKRKILRSLARELN